MSFERNSQMNDNGVRSVASLSVHERLAALGKALDTEESSLRAARVDLEAAYAELDRSLQAIPLGPIRRLISDMPDRAIRLGDLL